MLTVSNYHYIRKNFNADYPSIFGVTPDTFSSQLRYLKTQGEFITPDDFLQNTASVINAEENYFLVTFDDGLKEQYEFAVPVLEEEHIKAVFFINSINHIEKKVSLVHKIHLVRSVFPTKTLYKNLIDFTGRQLHDAEKEMAINFYRFDDPESASFKYFLNVLTPFETQQKFINTLFSEKFDETEVLQKLYMSENEIVEISNKFAIGSHTHTHLPLGVYSDEVVADELSITKQYLSDLCNKPIDMVAYPYGSGAAINQNVAEIAKKTGYKAGFTTVPDVNRNLENLLLLNRFDCNDLARMQNSTIIKQVK